MSDRFPVYVTVTRDDGRTEQVRIGTAVRAGDGFSLSFDAMSIGGTAMKAPAARAAASSSAPRASAGPSAASGMVFPPYGRSKGLPVAGASMQDLEFYANGCRRTLADPGKARWHDKERQLLAAIEGEIDRQRGGGGGDDDGIPPPGDGDAPPDDGTPF